MPHSKKILVVEDEVLIAMVMADQLREAGFDVVEACSMVEAEAVIAGSLDLQLAILDLDLKGHSTAPLAAKLRSKGVPFMVCSGSQVEDVTGIFANVTTLSKPYQDAELLGAVNALVSAQQVGQPLIVATSNLSDGGE